MLKSFVSILFLLFIMTSSAVADDLDQMLRGKWWHNKRISAQIKLTDIEKDGLDKKFFEHRRSVILLKSKVDLEQLEYSLLLEQPKLDEEAVLKQFKKLEAVRADLAAERFTFLLHIRKVLGHERFQELQSSYQKLRPYRKAKDRKHSLRKGKVKKRKPKNTK